MADVKRLWTPGFVLLNLQFMLVSAALALFFPFHAYLALLGFTQESAGFIIGADALASLLVQPLVAVFIHPGNARRWLAMGALVMAGAMVLQGQFVSFLPLAGARLIQGAGFSCVVAALVTLIVQSIPQGLSGQAFGWISMVRLIPYATVPSLLEFAGFNPAGFDKLLLGGALLALAPLIVMGLSSAAHAGSAAELPGRAPGKAAIIASLRQRQVLLLLIAGLLLYGGYSAAFFHLRGLGQALGLSNGGLFFSIATLVMIGVRLAGGWLFDRYSKVRLSVLGFGVIAIAYAVLPWVPNTAAFLGLACLLGLGWGAVMPLQSALMFEVSGVASRALNQNLLLVCMQAGFFLGPALGGVLLCATGFAGLFVAAATTSVAAAWLSAQVRATEIT